MNLALFDLDHTLLPLDSDHAWGQFTVELGWRDAAVFAKANDAFYEQYKAGTLDINTKKSAETSFQKASKQFATLIDNYDNNYSTEFIEQFQV